MNSIVVLGEKDHGKSTLIGRLIFETKSMPDDRLRDVRKAIQKSGKRFEWAHLLDSFRYEKEQEMTLDTTRTMIKFNKRLCEFIDVPGHKELIKNMLTGAADAKFAILVIDADEGVRPQTLKHLEIAKFLGIQKMITVVNKMDKIGYSQIKFTEIASKFENTIPVAAFSGDNLLKKSSRLKWYRGSTLEKAILKNFKHKIPSDDKLGNPKSAKNFSANCLFIEKPGKSLLLESGSRTALISKLTDFKKINSPEAVSLSLKKRAKITKKFVIKTKGKIIGICRLA